MSVPTRTARRRHYLLCAPTHFDVCYSINPWIDPGLPTATELALSQWGRLHGVLTDLGHQVELIEPVPGLPDMVFAANGAIAADGRALVARFRHAQRAGESPAYLDWFRARGYREVEQAAAVNEGEGDFLTAGEVILAGTGFRSDPAAHEEVAGVLRQEGHGPDARGPAVLPPGHGDRRPGRRRGRVPAAGLLRRQPGAARRALPRRHRRDGGRGRACSRSNAVSDGRHVILPTGARRLAAELRERGFEPIGVDTTELLKAGGGAKCCTLELHGVQPGGEG